jgi:thiol-disulfide isomerase/thioredoxin
MKTYFLFGAVKSRQTNRCYAVISMQEGKNHQCHLTYGKRATLRRGLPTFEAKYRNTMMPCIRVLVLISLLCANNVLYAGNVIIKGRITNRLAEQITFSTDDGWLEYTPIERKATLDKDGRFSVVLPVAAGYAKITLEHGDQASELYLKSGDVVQLTVDAKDVDKSIHYTGTGAVTANFTAKYIVDRGLSHQFGMDLQPFMTMAPQTYLSACRDRLQQEINYLQQHKQGLPDAFVKQWEATLTYTMYYDWLLYPMYHKMVTKKEPSEKIPAESFTVTAAIPMTFDDGMLHLAPYRNVVGSLFVNRMGMLDSVQALLYKKDDSSAILAKQLLPRQSREYYFAHKLYSGLKYTTVSKANADYEAFRQLYPRSQYMPVINKAIKLKRKLGTGQQAPDFEFTTIDGKKMKLSDLKGKVVYIDFWASWCGPCMQEVPHAQKLEEHFSGRDVVFLNISLDEKAEAWKNAIEKKQIQGMHTRQDGGWKAPVAVQYGIQGIPAYFLIDKNGRFVTETTPRPSETENLTTLIEKALN